MIWFSSPEISPEILPTEISPSTEGEITATSWCISDEPCQWEKTIFDPPQLRHLLTDRAETKVTKTSGRPPQIQISLRSE